MQEAAAGIKNADIIDTSDAGHFELLKGKGMLLKFTPQGVAGFSDGFKDKAGFYYGMRSTLSVMAHNPKILPEKDAPKTWKDLLNPRWSGKLVTAHPGYSGIIVTHVLALVNLYGWDYFRDLAKNKLHIVQSALDPAGIVASGERPVGVNGAEYFYYRTQKRGNPIRIIYPQEGVPLSGLASGHCSRMRPIPTPRSFSPSLFSPKSRSSCWRIKKAFIPAIRTLPIQRTSPSSKI